MSLVSQGFSMLSGGMNSSVAPLLLSDVQCARAINTSVRGGFASTRPGFVRDSVALPAGVFQGAARWSFDSGDRLVMVIGGKVYVAVLDTNTVTEIAGATLHVSSPCYFCQAHRFMVIQDGSSTPVVLDNDALYTGDRSIPVGTVMYYVYQRLHVAALAPDRTSFKSGDIMLPTNPASCLKFIEDTYWGEGGASSMPAEHGYIHGMNTFRNASTGTGVGSFLVFARNGVCAFDLSIARETWGSVNSSQVLFAGSGTRSPWSIVPVNDDLFYRSDDGLRSVRFTKNWVGGNQGAMHNMPSSYEVGDWFEDEPEGYLRYASIAFWKQWLLATTGGTEDRYFRGLVALDAAATYAMTGTATAPVYTGLWTGLDVAQVLVADREQHKEMFVVAKGPVLYRLSTDALDDDGTPIESRVITKSFQLGEDAVGLKQLLHVDLWLKDIQKSSTVTVYFRPTGYTKWVLLGVPRTVEALPAGGAAYRRRLRFSLDNVGELVDTSTKDLLAVGTEFQLAVEVVGNLTIERGQLWADTRGEAPPEPVDVALEAGALAGVDLDDYSYRIGGS